MKELNDEAVISIGNRPLGLYFTLEVLPYDRLEVLSLAGVLDLLVGDEQADSYQYTEIAGLPAVRVDTHLTLEGRALRRRWALVDASGAVLVLQWWGWADWWAQYLESIESMQASLEVTGPFPEGRWVDEPEPALAEQGLLEARADAALSTRPWRNADQVVPPEGSGFEIVQYPSAGRELSGYLTSDPADGGRHPAVLWVEGGFGGPGAMWLAQPRDNDQSTRQLQNAGIVVFAPAFRGENGNPGDMELFYGETEDLLAALSWLRTVPWVDPERIYLAGHSSGGTNVLLAAAAGARARASFVFGGRADLTEVAKTGGYGIEPFDPSDPQHIYLRSPIHWADDLSHPVFYFEGENSYLADAVAMGRLARAHGARMEVFAVPRGTHSNILAPLKELVANRILSDTGPTVGLHFDEAELFAAMTAPTPGE